MPNYEQQLLEQQLQNLQPIVAQLTELKNHESLAEQILLALHKIELRAAYVPHMCD